jgi:peptidoglycan-associated lipoprotein
MMRKEWMAAALTAMLVLGGCSQKEPEVDMTKQGSNQGGTVTNVDAGLDTIAGSENGAGGSSQDARMAAIRAIQSQAKTIYFDFDKYNIRSDQQARLDDDARLFTGADAKDLTIKIEGNCDEWGTDEYNYALGLKRAKSVRDALALKGVDENRMVMVSFGESNPVCTEHTQECWAKNRRVDFVLLP